MFRNSKAMENRRIAFYLLISVVSLIRFEVSSATNEEQVSDANNAFSVKLYKELLKSDDNLVCSPFSLSTVLSILWDGATGVTSTEIQTALLYQDLTRDNVDSGYKTLLPSLQSSTNYNLTVANAIFILQTFKVLQTYIDNEKDNYYADILELVNADSVNNWANLKTNGLIPKILDELPADAVMVLANAVYFKSSWQFKFPTKSTLLGNFKKNDLEDQQTNLMHRKASFPYSESEELKAQILHLPYEGSDMFMIVFLPKEGSTLIDMESKLNDSNLMSAIKNDAITKYVDVTLPKFQIESSFDLNDPLKNLGMKTAFSDSADFSDIANAQLKVSKVVQKAIIKVSEEGTEAAAVTAVVITKLSIGPDPIVFEANHPFMYVLYHKPTDCILFAGRYTKAS